MTHCPKECYLEVHDFLETHTIVEEEYSKHESRKWNLPYDNVSFDKLASQLMLLNIQSDQEENSGHKE